MKLGTVMVYVGAADLEVCGRWYHDVLGFEVSDAGESIWLGGDDGGARLGLHSGHEAPAEHVVELYFDVEDVDVEATRLRAAGIEFDGPEDMSWGSRNLHLHDPAGTAVWLMS